MLMGPAQGVECWARVGSRAQFEVDEISLVRTGSVVFFLGAWETWK